MTRIDAIAAMLRGRQVYNHSRDPAAQRWHEIEDPLAVDTSAIDWEQILGGESDDYRLWPA